MIDSGRPLLWLGSPWTNPVAALWLRSAGYLAPPASTAWWSPDDFIASSMRRAAAPRDDWTLRMVDAVATRNEHPAEFYLRQPSFIAELSALVERVRRSKQG